MIGKILLAYDGSENSRRALNVAAELSSKLGADLAIVHVLMHGRPASELVRMAEIEHLVEQIQDSGLPGFTPRGVGAYEMLDMTGSIGQAQQVISALGGKLVSFAQDRATELGARNVTTFVQSGDFADEILEVAKDEGADMIVIGSRGLGTLRATVLGSVSQKVLHHATQTVVTVR